jgi:hypothetical protein
VLKAESLVENYFGNLIYFHLQVNSYSASFIVVENVDKLQRNTDAHSLNTRCKCDLHMPYMNLTKYKKGVYYTGIKLFNSLPPTIKSLNHDIKVFKPALEDYILTHSFYSVDDFTSVKNS